MPIFEFTSPEGKTYEVEGPEGATKEQAWGILQQQLRAQGQAPAEAEVEPMARPLEQEILPEDVPFDDVLMKTKPRDPTPSATFGERAVGVGETLLSIGYGATGGTVGMTYGFANGLLKSMIDGTYGTPEGASAVEQEAMEVAQTLSYEPKTEEGKRYTKVIAEIAEKYGVPLAGLAPGVQALTGVAIKPKMTAGILRDRARARIDRRLDEPLPEPNVPGPDSGVRAAPDTGRSTYSTMSDAADPDPMTVEELASTMRKASRGGMRSKEALRILAEEAAPDPETVAAAERLGITDFLQPDHVSSNQQYRALAQGVKSAVGSKARMEELAGFEQIYRRVDDIVTELGGTDDWSTLSADTRARLSTLQNNLDASAEQAFKVLNDGISPRTPVQTPNILQFLNGKLEDIGGRAADLTPMERTLLRRFTPAKDKRITYALLDKTRKELTTARIKNEGVFKDAGRSLIETLENHLKRDQHAIADQHGLLDTYTDAHNMVRMRKGYEKDMTALFGKQLSDNYVGKLSGAVKALEVGDETRLMKIINSIPEDLRSQAVASSLTAAMGMQTRKGVFNFNTYANWYDKASRNRKSFNALMQHLPPEARQNLKDLATVSVNIRKATQEYISTGRQLGVNQLLKGADNLMHNMFSIAGAAAREGVGSTVTGMPGFTTLMSHTMASRRSRTPPANAVHDVITSPEFVNAVMRGEVEELAKSSKFRNFVGAVNREAKNTITNPLPWLIGAMLDEGDTDVREEPAGQPPVAAPPPPAAAPQPAEPATGQVQEMQERTRQMSEALGTRGLIR